MSESPQEALYLLGVQTMWERLNTTVDEPLLRSNILTALTHKDPVEDEVLLRQNDQIHSVENKPFRPANTPLPYMSGETSSWSFTERPWLTQKWGIVQEKLAAFISVPFDKAHETALELKNYVNEVFLNKRSEFIKELVKKDVFPNGYNPSENLIMTKSGADAIIGVYRLMGAPKHKVTTNENGSQVTAGLRKDYTGSGEESMTEIALRGSESELITKETVLEQYKKAIEGGARFVSATLMSKTGLEYSDVVQELADYVLEFNEQHSEDQIIMVIDAVQKFGRSPIENIFKFIDHKGVSAVIHSGSKAPGGVPHAGFVWVTETGNAHMQATQQSMRSAGIKRSMESIVGEHRLMVSKENHLLGRYADQSTSELNALLRASDNMDAIIELANRPPDKQLYGPRAENFKGEYAEVFKNLGFVVLDADEDCASSIISMELPKDIENGKTKIMLAELAKKGISMGGVVDQKGHRPIVRWALHNQLLASDITTEELRDLLQGQDSKVNGFYKIFENALKVARSHTK